MKHVCIHVYTHGLYRISEQFVKYFNVYIIYIFPLLNTDYENVFVYWRDLAFFRIFNQYTRLYRVCAFLKAVPNQLL